MPRVLVIDDSRATRVHLVQLLEQEGWEVEAEADGEQGAARALSSPPDLVISDFWMPGLSGLQLCRLLHEDVSTAQVPIVLMSASLDRRSRFWAEQSGASLTLDKKRLGSADLHAVLCELIAAAGPHPARTPREHVPPKAIPMRLSLLLDRALFQSVVAKELRSLAIAPQLDSFFSGLVSLLGRIVPFRWIALSTASAHGEVLRVHGLPNQGDQASAEAIAALGSKYEVIATADDRGQQDADSRGGSGSAAQGELVVLDIQLGDTLLGHLAIRGYDSRWGAPDRDLLELVRIELPHALRAVLLVEETRRLASTDMLTGLWNRRQGTELLEQALSASQRYGQALSVAMIDIDFFKKINDKHGHHSGDLALRHVAEVVRRTCRKADTVARWGGEEFLIVMPSTGAAGARIAGERARVSVAANPARVENDVELQVTISVGIATEDRDDGTPLLSRADRALYAAKSRGRNRVEVG